MGNSFRDNLLESPSLAMTHRLCNRRDIEGELPAVICYYSVLLKQFISLKIYFPNPQSE